MDGDIGGYIDRYFDVHIDGSDGGQNNGSMVTDIDRSLQASFSGRKWWKENTFCDFLVTESMSFGV